MVNADEFEVGNRFRPLERLGLTDRNAITIQKEAKNKRETQMPIAKLRSS